MDLVKKYLPFFRTTIEKSFPALLRLREGRGLGRGFVRRRDDGRQSVEPMPRLISFLDSFGEERSGGPWNVSAQSSDGTGSAELPVRSGERQSVQGGTSHLHVIRDIVQRILTIFP